VVEEIFVPVVELGSEVSLSLLSIPELSSELPEASELGDISCRGLFANLSCNTG